MQEVKRPKKPLIYFYVAMILAILVQVRLRQGLLGSRLFLHPEI